MIDLHSMRDDEWDYAVDLMRTNMEPYYERYGLLWDLEWIEAEYRQRSNWIVTDGRLPVGFVSCESFDDRLHVHTFQLAKAAQGRRVAFNVIRLMEKRLIGPSMSKLSCKVFKDHWARGMYIRMGFIEVAAKGNLVSLELPLIDGRCVIRRPNPLFQRTASPPLN